MPKINNERGVALITALLVLAILTMLGLAATLVSSTDMKIAGNEKVATQVQYAAEAGIAQAIVMLNTSTAAGVIREPSPSITWDTRTDSTYLDWVRPVKGNIMDGASVFSTFSATVSYKEIKKGGIDMVAFYNTTSGFSNAPSATGGWPVFEFRSISRRGDSQSQVNILEVTKKSYTYKVKAGFTAGGPLELRGTPTLDGQHHDENGNVVATGSGCKSDALNDPMPAVFANGTTTPIGTPNFLASPGVTDPTVNSSTGIPNSPWDALGIPYDGKPGEDFVSLFPTGTWPKEYDTGSSLTGDNYYQDDAAPIFQNANITGNGLLILHNKEFVPGECARGVWDGACDTGETAPCDDCLASKAPAGLDANTGTFKGLIIADQVSLRGNVTIIGGLVSLTTIKTEATGAGNPTILYSCQAIEKYAGGQINRKLNWRRE